MEITLGKLLSTGGACNVYELEKGKLIKLYFHGYDINSVKWEYDKTLNARKNSLSAPHVFDIIEYNGRFGIIMERINGKTLMDIMFEYIMYSKSNSFDELFKSPEILGNIQETARLLYKVHSVYTDLIDTIESSLIRSVHNNQFLSDTEKRIVNEKIGQLPKRKSVCHGDPNPGNIIKNGESFTFIDWVNAGTGHPFYDLTQYVLMNRYVEFPSGMPDKIVKLVDENKEKINDAFLSEYFKLSGMDKTGIDDWIIPVCVEKLNATAISGNKKEEILQDIRELL